MNNWQIWIDTGGTFTDCIGVDPDGRFYRIKVLSSSALRGKIDRWLDERTLKVEQDWDAPTGFVQGFQFKLLHHRKPDLVEVASFDAQKSVLKLKEWTESEKPLTSFELLSPYEAPILAARLITGTMPGRNLPPVDLRLATTKGTNALLERKGAPATLFITRGFRDLLMIGDQKRPDLFALKIEKPGPLYNRVIEIPERMDAGGNPVLVPDLKSIQELLPTDRGDISNAAVCLMHSYKNSSHENLVAEALREADYDYISISSRLSPFVKILPRAQTTVVNAYLAPILQKYMDSIADQIPEGSFRMMTSAGGLMKAGRFNPKDSLLSGPAGGVVGAAGTGKRAGFKNIISFDMGGTSTDVSRYDGGYDYIFEHKVGDARLAAPALSIETVAAGGGSICSYDGFKLSVGPESAGADPGPACYGAGGPLTLTDVNLLLGRLEPDNFSIPVSVEAAEKRLSEIIKQVGSADLNRRSILEGFLDIANERMSDAIRKISLRKGYDPTEYAIVAFGGAGAQHVCAIADELDIRDIVIPADAGLLSASGLGQAVIEQFAEQQILGLYPEVDQKISSLFDKLEQQAARKVIDEGVEQDEIVIRKRVMFMRLKGQESTLEIEFDPESDILRSFEETYRQRYGHWIPDRDIEVESIRVIASGKQREPDLTLDETTKTTGKPVKNNPVIFDGRQTDTPVFIRRDLAIGQEIQGPAVILDPYSTTILEPRWKIQVLSDGSLKLTKSQKDTRENNLKDRKRTKPAALELFTNRFSSIAEEMGEMLRRTALSVNVKERMDFSCALLNARGELIVNAPHIPVHLGALGICIRRLKESIEMNPGDVIVTNHPAFGGSHLPDITVVTPVFTTDRELIGFAASRAHHAEIGGTRPGSMPPDATTLAGEGVVIPPVHLVKQGEEQWKNIRKLLLNAEFPTRSVEENIADLRAAVAANHRGVRSLLQLADKHGKKEVLHYMDELSKHASGKIKSTLNSIPNGIYSAEEYLDDGNRLAVRITVADEKIEFDFEGTSGQHPGNLNATPAIVNSVIMYVLRLLIDEPIPLNEGLLDPVEIKLPRSLLNPEFAEDPKECPAVVGGNVETSQRLVDLLLKPFEIVACSQGTMNNVLFGNESFGYYETIGGGTGAGDGFHGADAVHHHMTNTAGTDPEILEQSYPVRLDRYAIRTESGGDGKWKGGNGIEREMTFLQPVSLSVLTQHREEAPYGMKGGEAASIGKQWVVRKDGSRKQLKSIDGRELRPGDRFILHSPGGGGYGSKNRK